MTCHKAHNVFDVVPGDVVGSVILTTAAATVQVSTLRLRIILCKPHQQLPALGTLAVPTALNSMAEGALGNGGTRLRGAVPCGSGQDCRSGRLMHAM